ncbi:MAG: cytochrome-c oxidase, cbb3-type subunit II, partial [Xanthomonadaceae bacterium]|nr:cytochrome-c oxidase, cbb3-type subunit II [Xanthomonadaceae bacterium]
MKHERLETNSGLLLLFIMVIISIGGLIEIVPLFYIDDSIEEVKKEVP